MGLIHQLFPSVARSDLNFGSIWLSWERADLRIFQLDSFLVDSAFFFSFALRW